MDLRHAFRRDPPPAPPGRGVFGKLLVVFEVTTCRVKGHDMDSGKDDHLCGNRVGDEAVFMGLFMDGRNALGVGLPLAAEDYGGV